MATKVDPVRVQLIDAGHYCPKCSKVGVCTKAELKDGGRAICDACYAEMHAWCQKDGIMCHGCKRLGIFRNGDWNGRWLCNACFDAWAAAGMPVAGHIRIAPYRRY